MSDIESNNVSEVEKFLTSIVMQGYHMAKENDRLRDAYDALYKGVVEHFHTALDEPDQDVNDIEDESLCACSCEEDAGTCGCCEHPCDEPADVDEEEINPITFDVILDEDAREMLKVGAEKLRKYIDMEDYSLPEGDAGIAAALTVLTTELTKDRPKGPKHVHVDASALLRAICIDTANTCGGEAAAVEVFRTIADYSGDYVDDKDQTLLECFDSLPTVEHTHEELDLIEAGVLWEHSYIMTQEQILKALSLDYTVLSLPGIPELFKAMNMCLPNNGTDFAADIALRLLYMFSGYVWNNKNTSQGMRALMLAIMTASDIRQDEVQEQLDKLAEELDASSVAHARLITLQQAEQVYAKSRTELARVIEDCTDSISLRIVQIPNNNGNVFVLDTSELDYPQYM